MKVWVNQSGCSKRQSVNDQLTYNPIIGVIHLYKFLLNEQRFIVVFYMFLPISYVTYLLNCFLQFLSDYSWAKHYFIRGPRLLLRWKPRILDRRYLHLQRSSSGLRNLLGLGNTSRDYTGTQRFKIHWRMYL